MSTHERDIVAAVLRLPGVSSADVESDAADGSFAVHVALHDGADSRAVADAVTRTLHEQLGDGGGPARVHVLEDDPAPRAAGGSVTVGWTRPSAAAAPATPLPRQATPRPSIVRLDLVSTGLEYVTTVVLASRTRAATGEARGVATRNGLRRSAATATLRALERLLGDGVRLELERVETAPHGDNDTAVVSLTLISARGPEHLAGAALIRDDESRAVVRATLDALNRRLEPLLA